MAAECPYNIPLNDTERIVFMCLTAFSGLLSVAGSTMIIYNILRGGLKRINRMRNRFVLGMSIVDIFSSAAFGLSIIPSPQETVCSIGMGNKKTCMAQGFFMQMGMAVPAYNAMLSIYFIMTIRYKMDQSKLVAYEVLMHAYALIPPLATAIIGVTNKLFFNEVAPCWIGDVCKSLGTCPNGNEWGSGKWIVISTYIFTTANIFITGLSMSIIYMTLQNTNYAMSNHLQHERYTRVRNQRLSAIEFAANEFLKQGILFGVALFVTFIWAIIDIFMTYIATESTQLSGWYTIIWGITFPLQGFWNFFAYVRPIVSAIRRRENDSNISFFAATKKIFGKHNDQGLNRGRGIRRRGGLFDVQVPTSQVFAQGSTMTADDSCHIIEDEEDEEDLIVDT